MCLIIYYSNYDILYIRGLSVKYVDSLDKNSQNKVLVNETIIFIKFRFHINFITNNAQIFIILSQTKETLTDTRST